MMPRLKKTGRLVFATVRKCLTEPSEALLLLRMTWWLAILSGTVKLFSLPSALEFVSGKSSPHNDKHDAEIPDHLGRSIDLLLSADVLFIRPICWKRAAVLRRYLSKHGFATKILFGVKQQEQGKVSGHAWLEFNGQPILENSPPEYVVTYVFPPDGNSPAHLAFLRSE